MRIKSGGKQFSVLVAAAVAMILGGCSYVTFVELRNEDHETIYVRDVSKKVVVIPPGGTAFLDPGKELSIERPRPRSFEMQRVPAKYVQSAGRGFVVYAILGNDGALYLAKKAADGTLSKIDPQPDGFPLKGH